MTLLGMILTALACILYLVYMSEYAVVDDLMFFGYFDAVSQVEKALQFSNWKVPIVLLAIGLTLICS